MKKDKRLIEIYGDIDMTKAFTEVIEFTCQRMIDYQFANSDTMHLGLSCMFDALKCRLDVLEGSIEELACSVTEKERTNEND